MADERVEIEIVLDDGSIQKGFLKVEKGAKKTASKSEQVFKKSFGAIGAAVAGVAAALGAAFAVRKVVDAARAQEDAVNRFNTALKLSGKFTQAASRDFQDFASELQRTTKVGDELTLETAALIQGLGQLEGEALKDATKAAVDLSAALGIDLKAAALLVGKAAAGEVSSFSRYGLVIKKGANNAETFTRALTGIQDKFGGSAAAQVQTFSGRIDQLGNAFGDTLEGVGDLIIKLPVVSGVIGKISGFFLDAADKLKSFTDNQEGITTLNNQLIDFGANVIAFVVVPIEQVVKVVDAVFLSLQAGFETIVAVGATAVEGFAQLFNLLPGVDDIDLSAFEGIRAAAADTANQANAAIGSIGQVGEEDFSVGLLNGLEQFRIGVDATGNSLTGLEPNLENLKKKTQETAFEFKITGKEIAGGIAQGVQGAVKASQSGGNALEGFFGAFLGFIGNWAIQTGTTLLTVGLGIDALKASIVGLTGGPAIAAGIALIALGTLLSSLSGGGGAPAGGAETAGGGSASATGTAVDETATAPTEELQKTTEVAINVEGTVLSPREVGDQLAQILNDNFEAGGTRVVTA